MLEQQQASKEAQQTYAPTVSPNHTAASALTPHANALMAAYVTQVDVEQQTVTRARLEELIAAHLELDAEPEQAARSAIQQLENERLAEAHQHTMAKRQAFQQRKRTRSAKQSARPATLTALKLFGPGALALIGVNTALTTGHYNTMVTLFMLFGLPVLLGTLAGAHVRHRPAVGTFYALGMLIPLASLVAMLALFPFPVWMQDYWATSVIMLLLWMPLGVLSAGITGWGRNTLRRNRCKDAAAKAARVEA